VAAVSGNLLKVVWFAEERLKAKDYKDTFGERRGWWRWYVWLARRGLLWQHVPSGFA
jgi:hypothetical protein